MIVMIPTMARRALSKFLLLGFECKIIDETTSNATASNADMTKNVPVELSLERAYSASASPSPVNLDAVLKANTMATIKAINTKIDNTSFE